MKDVKIRVSADTSKAEESMKSLGKETKDLKKGVNETSEATSGLTNKLDSMTGGAITGFRNMLGGIKSAVVGLKTLRGAVMATGIGALVVVVASLIQSFKSSEEGQNRWAKAMGMIGAVTGVITDGLAALGTLVIDVFTKPTKVFKDFKDSIKTYVIDQITIVTDGLGLLGSAIKKAFSGDFSGALDDAGAGLKKLYVEANPLVQAIGGIAGATKDLVKEMTEEAKIAGKIADQRAKADKLDRALIVERAEANRKRAELLEKAVDKENYTAKERIEFLKEAGKVEDDITQKEIASAQLRLDAKIKENSLGLSTKEDLEEEANLRATLINLETAKLTKAKEVTSQIIALNAEEVASNKAKSDAKKAQIAQDQADEKALKDKYDAFTINTEEEKRIAAQDKLRTEFEELLLQLGDDEEAKLELTKSYLEKQKELTDTYADEDEAKRKDAAQKEIDELKAVEDAKASVREAAIGTIKNGLGLLRQLGEDNKALQATALIGESAIGIAEMVINKTKADLVAAPIAANPVTAAAGAAILAMNKVNLGIGIASNVAATAKGLAALGKGGAPSGGSEGQGAAQAPSFNLVEGTEISQLERSVNSQGGKPVKAYVTSGDITTAQQADRQAELNSGF